MGITITGISQADAQNAADRLDITIEEMRFDGEDVEIIEDIQSALRKVRD